MRGVACGVGEELESSKRVACRDIRQLGVDRVDVVVVVYINIMCLAVLRHGREKVVVAHTCCHHGTGCCCHRTFLYKVLFHVRLFYVFLVSFSVCSLTFSVCSLSFFCLFSFFLSPFQFAKVILFFHISLFLYVLYWGRNV